jgi:hypothetical protein
MVLAAVAAVVDTAAVAVAAATVVAVVAAATVVAAADVAMVAAEAAVVEAAVDAVLIAITKPISRSLNRFKQKSGAKWFRFFCLHGSITCFQYTHRSQRAAGQSFNLLFLASHRISSYSYDQE